MSTNKKDDDGTAMPVLVSKPLATKKQRKKKNKVTKYFAPKLNYQGFPMVHCKFRPEVNKFVYFPPKYGLNTMGKYGPEYRRSCSFCEECMLWPCVTREYVEDFVDKWVELSVSGNNSHEKIAEAMQKCMVAKMKRFFGAAYMKNFGTPFCVIQEVSDFMRRREEEEDSEEEEAVGQDSDDEGSSDEENEF